MASSPPASGPSARSSISSPWRTWAACLALVALAWSFLAPHAGAHRSAETFRDVACSLGESHPDAPAHLESAEAGIHAGCLTCWLQLGTGAALPSPDVAVPGLSVYGAVTAAGLTATSPSPLSLAPARAPPSSLQLSA